MNPFFHEKEEIIGQHVIQQPDKQLIIRPLLYVFLPQAIICACGVIDDVRCSKGMNLTCLSVPAPSMSLLLNALRNAVKTFCEEPFPFQLSNPAGSDVSYPTRLLSQIV